MIRKALRREKEKELREETENEIEEELALVAKLCEARKEWKKFRDSSWKNIPKYTQPDYEKIYDDIWTREIYGEPDETLLKEMVALSLLRCADEYWSEEKARSQIYAFVRTALAYQKNLIRWVIANEVYNQLKSELGARIRISDVIKRLLERLSDLPGNARSDHQTRKKLLLPLTKALGIQPWQSPPTIVKMMGKVALLNRLEFNKIANEALHRMETMLGNLPNPNFISCESAMRRVIEMYECNLTEQNITDIPKDGAILDHIIFCGKKCAILAPYICDRTLGRMNPKLPNRTNNSKKAIEKAKKILAAQTQ